MEDHQLVDKARKGDRQAFSRLYHQYIDSIYRFVLLKIGNKQLAEDITSQVFLQAWKHIRRYRITRVPFSGWLYRIARNQIIDFYRSYRPRLSLDETKLDIWINNPVTEFDEKAELRQIYVALKKLSEIQQSVVIMKFIEGLSNKEIAQALRKSEGAVKLIQHRAIKKLKEELYEHRK